MKEQKYYIVDPESGWRYEVTKEQHEKYMEMIEMFRPKLLDDHKIVPLIYGIGGDMEGNSNDWSKWWKTNKKEE